MNNRIKHALELRQQGVSFNQIGIELGIGSERARRIVRKYQQHLKLMEDPFALKIKELNRLADATRILNALRGNDLYNGDPEKLTDCKPEDIRKIKWSRHEKRRDHCQCFGRLGIDRGCRGMVGKTRTPIAMHTRPTIFIFFAIKDSTKESVQTKGLL